MSKQNTNSKSSKSEKVKEIVRQTAKTVDKVAPAVTNAIDLIKLFKSNHPIWYTNYATSNLVQLNLADKLGIHYPTLTGAGQTLPAPTINKFEMPTVAQIRMALTVPQNDQDGWKSGVRLLWQQIRTANSGKINFTVQDLEKYILNTRALHYFCATLNRLYKATYTFRSTSSEFPKRFIEAMGFNFDSMMANAADIFAYLQRYHQQVRVTFPLDCPLIDRTHWLFENVFVDSESDKPQFYVPTIPFGYQANYGTGTPTTYKSITIPMWYDAGAKGSDPSTTLDDIFDPFIEIGTSYSDDNAGYGITWKVLRDACDIAKNRMLESTKMSIIAGDIIKAFGDAAFSKLIISSSITDSLTAIYDQSAMNQFQNATVLMRNLAGQSDSQALTGDFRDKIEFNTLNSMRISLSEPRYIPDVSNTDAGWATMVVRTVTEDTALDHSYIRNVVSDQYTDYMVNWHANSITPGDILSITRLVMGDYGLSQLSVGTAPEYNVVLETFQTFGTEIVLGVYAICDIPDIDTRDANGNNMPLLVPIAGHLYYNTSAPSNSDDPNLATGRQTQGLTMSLWSIFDWAPRLTPHLSVIVNRDATFELYTDFIWPELLDWDVFATVSDQLKRNYFSYGNQSLLYAGPSRNQSNTDVYTTGTMKQQSNKKTNKYNRSHELPDDKR
nr:putative capsid [Marmot picobirnavirus]